MPLADVVDLLACPVCASRDPGADPGLRLDDRSLRCPAGHAYDLARQGYVNLTGQPEPRNADTAAMVAARERFLDGGTYAPVAAVLLETVLGLPRPVGTVLEAGAGPGWYLAQLLPGLAAAGVDVRGLALDVSVAAARRAAGRLRPLPAGVLVADVWSRLPVRSATVDVVLSVFAPRHAAEFARVLRPGGHLVVVSPLPAHLAGLRETLGLLEIEPGKQERLAAVLGDQFEAGPTREVAFRAALSADRVVDLVLMGPNAFHHAHGSLVDPAAVVPAVEVAVEVGVWRRRD